MLAILGHYRNVERAPESPPPKAVAHGISSASASSTVGREAPPPPSRPDTRRRLARGGTDAPPRDPKLRGDHDERPAFERRLAAKDRLPLSSAGVRPGEALAVRLHVGERERVVRDEVGIPGLEAALIDDEAMRARALWIALAASRTLSRRFVRRAPQPGAWARSTSRAFMTFPIGLRGNASRKHRGHERRAADPWAEFVRARGSMRPAVREPDDREALEPQGVRDYLDVVDLARLSPCTPSAGCRRYRR
jgi:hypothetical protein